MTCRGCDTPIPLRESGRGRQRVWCSDACRKRTLYSRPCAECGGLMNGSDGLGSRAPRVCKSCNGIAVAAMQRAKWAPHKAKVERLWAEGLTAREIAAGMGWTYRRTKSNGNTANAMISSLRLRGYDLPHRRPQMVENGKRTTQARGAS